MKSAYIAVVILLLAGAVAIVAVSRHRDRQKSIAGSKAQANFPAVAVEAVPPSLPDNIAPQAQPTPSHAARGDLLDTIIDKLSQTADPVARQALLDETLAWLKTLSASDAAAILTRFLDSGQDFNLGMPFRVGIGGNLASHPTLRIAALDWLGQISPNAAKDYARAIFEHSDNADEWALALRNYGRLTQPGADAYYSAQVDRILTDQKWLEQPTGGLVESFDALVYDRRYDSLSLALRIGQDFPHLLRPAQLLIDSLCIHNPSAVYNYALNNPQDFQEIESMRALIFARADVRDPAQRRLVESYLSAPYLAPNEAIAFCHQFPLFSKSTGPRLLTIPLPLSLSEYARIDNESLKVATEWQRDPRYSAHSAQLNTMIIRLQNVVDSARRGGVLNDGGT